MEPVEHCRGPLLGVCAGGCDCSRRHCQRWLCAFALCARLPAGAHPRHPAGAAARSYGPEAPRSLTPSEPVEGLLALFWRRAQITRA
eukprot:4339369-Pyramimonas_sp.AAC.1